MNSLTKIRTSKRIVTKPKWVEDFHSEYYKFRRHSVAPRLNAESTISVEAHLTNEGGVVACNDAEQKKDLMNETSTICTDNAVTSEENEADENRMEHIFPAVKLELNLDTILKADLQLPPNEFEDAVTKNLKQVLELESNPRCTVNRSPDRATEICDTCGYRSSLQGVRKHKLRYHPEQAHQCLVCGRSFGIKYEMRHHRMKHFDRNGELLVADVPIFLENNPGSAELPHLAQLEKGFGVSSGKASKRKKVMSVEDKLTVVCRWCEKQGSRDEMNVHEHRHHSSITFNCVICDERFGLINDLVDHRTQKHDETIHTKDELLENCQCRFCSFRGSQQDVQTHLKIVNHTLGLRCAACDLTFDSDQRIATHYCEKHPSHTITTIPQRNSKKPRILPRELDEYRCHICNMVFKAACNLSMHIRIHKRVSRCSECDFVTRRPCDLKKHMRIEHNMGKHCCYQCGKAFASAAPLQFHLKTVHEEEATVVKCDVCEKIFKDPRFLVTHVKRVHLKEKRYECDICGKQFFEKVRMNNHKDTHKMGSERELAKKYECDECRRRFKTSCQLQQHKNTHSGLRPFKCKICGKGFPWAAEVYRHMVVHSDEKPHKCHTCQKAFKEHHKLAAHMVVHTKKSKHRCMNCNKSFTIKATLKRHRCTAIQQHPLVIQEENEDNKDGIIYMCEICEKLVPRWNDMVEHLLEHNCASVDSKAELAGDAAHDDEHQDDSHDQNSELISASQERHLVASVLTSLSG